MKMKTNIYNSMLAGGLLLLCGCSDSWDDHYSDRQGQEGRLTLLDQIKTDPELSLFAKMIETAGYGEMLQSSQTFTVWAPTDDALKDMDLTDKAAVARTLANHIARFNISTATPDEEGVKMLNGKLMYFSGAGSFGGASIATADIHAKNGLMHKMKDAIPYSYNFREYIDTHSHTSRISEFLAQFDEMLLPSQIPGAEGISGTDTDPVAYNRLLQYPVYGLGDIACEDSVFSMAVPDNQAWNLAYERIKPYFKAYSSDPAVADSIQRIQTSLAIVSDLVFRTGLADPVKADSIISTGGSVISSPSSYFSGMTLTPASNGHLYLASALNYDMTETFNKKIRIEAEEQTGRTPAAGTTIYTRNVSTDNQFASEISGQRYIEVFPVSSSRQPGVTFAVPDVLAGAYDIYATFVPAIVSETGSAADSTRVQFAVSYLAENGRTQSKTFNDKAFLTSGTKMTTIKVASAFKMPVSNYYDRVWYMNPKNDPKDKVTTTSVYVSTNVSNAEFNRNELSRRFRIDRLIFVPVETEGE